MDLEILHTKMNVCHNQIEEKWRQQIIVVTEHEFSNIEGIDLEMSKIFSLENKGAVCVGIYSPKKPKKRFVFCLKDTEFTASIDIERTHNELPLNLIRHQTKKRLKVSTGHQDLL